MADGPAIQAAGLRALGRKTWPKRSASSPNSAPATQTTPIVLMGYYNPIYVHGVDAFLADAKKAGVDGLIVVDLPPEEDDELCLPALKAGLNFIRLATPTTDARGCRPCSRNTSGFVYYVSITGITGAATPDFSAKARRLLASRRTRICRSRSGLASRTRPTPKRSRPRRWRGGRLGHRRSVRASLDAAGEGDAAHSQR